MRTLAEIQARTAQRKAAGIAIGMANAQPTAPTPLPMRDVCQWEGSIVEYCKTCNGEARHVRMCLHPTADRDTCTRGVVSEAVQACATCKDWEVAG